MALADTWLTRARKASAVACLAIAGALAGVGLAPEEPAHAAAPTPLTIQVGHESLDAGQDLDAFTEDLAARWGEAPITIVIGEERVQSTRAQIGGSIDREALSSRLEAARDPASLMARFHRQVAGDEAPILIPLPVRFDSEPARVLFLERKDALDVAPRDARINPRTGEIIAERVGRIVDVHGSLDALSEALRQGAAESHVRIVREEPGRRASEIEGAALSAVLGSFETRYSTLEDSANRTYNLHVAVARIDGTVLLPGETFDFNAIVGERSEANGFRPAPQIAAGELVDGIGGGTCQIAGTLHAAAFYGGLPIVERSPHSRPSSYLWMGLDAVVVYPRLNLRFTNDLPHPIAISMTVEGGVVRAEIRGPERTRMVSLVRRIEEPIAYTEREVQDATLPAGVRVLRQRGVPGFRVTRFRVVRDVVSHVATRTRGEDTYPATPQIWAVGSGEAAPDDYVAPEGDSHPEYTADEYLSATQGPGIADLDVVRRSGRYAARGWTAEMGMPPAP